MCRIEDALHDEPQQVEYASIADALSELSRLADVPWNEPPNAAPCTNWRNCGRNYDIVEYDAAVAPWRELQRISALEVSATGVKWLSERLA